MNFQTSIMNNVRRITWAVVQYKLGEGATAEVSRADVGLDDGTQATGALKQLRPSLLRLGRYQEEQARLAAEAANTLRLQDTATHPSGAGCPHLPLLLAAGDAVDPGNTHPGQGQPPLPTRILMQHAGDTTLQDLLPARPAKIPGDGLGRETRRSVPTMTAIERWTIFRSVALAVEHMHKAGLAHCDIKPQNVVCTDSATTLVDLASAQPLGEQMVYVIGTPGFMAPEIHRAKHEGRTWTMTSKVDVHALGQLGWTMALRAGAWEEHELPRADLVKLIGTQGYAAAFPERDLVCCADMVKLLRFMTRREPRKRPSMSRVLKVATWGLEEAQRQHALDMAAAAAGPLAPEAATAMALAAAAPDASPSHWPCDLGRQAPADAPPAAPSRGVDILSAVLTARPPPDAPSAAPSCGMDIAAGQPASNAPAGAAPAAPVGGPCVLAAVLQARPPAEAPPAAPVGGPCVLAAVLQAAAPPAAPTAEVPPQQLSVAGPAAGHGEDILPKGLPQLATQPPAPAPRPEASSGQWTDVRDAAAPPEGSPSRLSQRTPYAAFSGSPQSLLQATPHWAHGSMPSTPGTAVAQQPVAAHPGPFAEGKPSVQAPVHAGRRACAGAPRTGPPPGVHGAHAKWVPPVDWHLARPFVPGARRMPAAPVMHAMQPAMWVPPGLCIVPVPPHQQMPWPVPGHIGQCWQGWPVQRARNI